VRRAAFGNFFGVMALFQSGRLVKVTLPLFCCLSVLVLGLSEMERGSGEKGWVIGQSVGWDMKHQVQFISFALSMDFLSFLNTCS